MKSGEKKEADLVLLTLPFGDSSRNIVAISGVCQCGGGMNSLAQPCTQPCQYYVCQNQPLYMNIRISTPTGQV